VIKSCCLRALLRIPLDTPNKTSGAEVRKEEKEEKEEARKRRRVWTGVQRRKEYLLLCTFRVRCMARLVKV